MKVSIGAGLARLVGHEMHADIVKRKLRDAARGFEALAEMSRNNAEAATFAALGPDGPPTPEFTRRQTWNDRPRLIERSNALGEIASAIRCELAALDRRAHHANP